MSKSTHISTYLKPELVQAIDRVRGSYSRSSFIEHEMTKILMETEG